MALWIVVAYGVVLYVSLRWGTSRPPDNFLPSAD